MNRADTSKEWSTRAVTRFPPAHRTPLVISGNHLAAGDRTTTFATGDPHALLRSYLIFVRDLRGQRREPSIELRSEDVAVLATHLGVAEASVLGGLLDLMGATRAQRSAAMAMLAAGALTVVLSGTVVNGLTRDGVSVEFDRLADAVHAAVVSSDPATPAIPEDAGAGTAGVPAGPTARSSPARSTPSVDVLQSVASTRAASGEAVDAPAEPHDAHTPVRIAATADGAPVASDAAPTDDPEPTATGQLPDGTTVAVATPPVPPPTPPPDDTEPTATGQLPDGTTVAVATPPVPPPTPPPTDDQPTG